MRLLFLADGRSPIALNWIQYFVHRGVEVHLASIYPCSPKIPLASLNFIPVAFSRAVASGPVVSSSNQPSSTRLKLHWVATPRLRTRLRHWLVPLSLPRASRRLAEVVSAIQPDMIHAMRIPYEGMLAGLTHSNAPLLISVWGNDFTLHANSTPWMAHLTHQAMRRADALHVDCHRDLRLAQGWGFSEEKPSIVLPGGGGVQMDIFFPPEKLSKPLRDLTVINPRGMRFYVRNDTFFQSLPLVLQRHPQSRFLCPAMAGERQAEGWVRRLGLNERVELLPRQSREQMAQLFRQSAIVVSITEHDGTPNTLLEAMACGCFPIAGDIESLREWIEPGVNGLLVPPGDPQTLAQAIIQAWEDNELRRQAREHNLKIIAHRAEYGQVMTHAESFYRQLIGRTSPV